MESVLVVDDDESLLELCERVLAMEGYRVTAVPGPAEALKRLEVGLPDLMLTDLMMPDEAAGRGLVRAARERFPTVDVALMTATPSLSSAIDVLKAGACDYIIKPFEVDHFKAMVRRILDQRKLRAELQSERALRRELETAYKELQKVEEIKEGILARVSHELRTPLMQLRGAVELIDPEGSAEQTRSSVAIAMTGLTRLDEVLRELLTFLELGGRPKLLEGAALDLAELARAAVERARPLWQDKKISVRIDLPATLPRVRGNADLLGQALFHLVRNAVLFNREGGEIRLSAEAPDRAVELSVADTGEGIPEAQTERVFDSFYQVASYLTRKVSGLGLGLALTRRIVETHGGIVTVRSAPGEGSVFKVRLPAA